MKIIDTHAHMYEEPFLKDIDAIVSECKANNIRAVFNNSDSFESMKLVIDLEKRFPNFFYSVLGIFPTYSYMSNEYFENAYNFILSNASHIKAIGEIGLDYHDSPSDEQKVLQKNRFIEQIRLAKKLDLPIVVHCRDALEETFKIIKEELPYKMDLHCYSGSFELVKEYLKLPIDFHIGIGGVCTFKNAKRLVDVIKQSPIEILLTETDSPFLSPEPFRGKINSPINLEIIINKISELLNVNKLSVLDQLYKNACCFYGIE